MVNRGEEKVRVHMNVLPRSTGNTNSGARELILFPFTRANAQWLTPSGLFMGLSSTIIYTSELILWFHYLCSQCYAAQHSRIEMD